MYKGTDLRSEALVYTLSIRPVDAILTLSAFMPPQIEPFKAALEQMAKKKRADYIDLAPIFREHKMQYDERLSFR